LLAAAEASVRRLIGILLIVSVAVGLALVVQFNEGNVAILWPPYRIDLSINLLAILLAAGFLLGYLLLYTIANAVTLPQRVRDFRYRRARNAAIRGLRDGLVALFEGRFGRAERLIKPALADAELAGPAALIAARAAHRLNDAARVEIWLERAESERDLGNAVLLTSAELAVEDRDPTRALEAVGRLHAGGARHIQALRVALRAHEQAGQWREVLTLVRTLEKREAIRPVLARTLRIKALRELLAGCAGNDERLDELLHELTPAERDLEEVVDAAVPGLVEAGRSERAAALLLAILGKRIDDRMVAAYAGLSALPARERLREIEALRDRFGEQASLALAAGRLCAAEGLWGKAEEFLRRAHALEPGCRTMVTLATLLEQLGQHDEAARLWREAALAGLPDPLPERPRAPISASGSATPPQLPDTP
jgi:HemY protein